MNNANNNNRISFLENAITLRYKRIASVKNDILTATKNNENLEMLNLELQHEYNRVSSLRNELETLNTIN